jgi:hypothetical protein
VVPIPAAPDSHLPPPHAEQNNTQFTTSTDFGETIKVPLGYIAHSRSGDKGGNSNVGFWTVDKESYEWLRATMTMEMFKGLMGKEGEGMEIKVGLSHRVWTSGGADQ